MARVEDHFVIHGPGIANNSWLANFSALGAVPLASWSASNAQLLERALAARRGAIPGDPLRHTVDAALAQLRQRCAASPPATCRLACALLRHTTSFAPKYLALSLLEHVLPGAAPPPAEERKALRRWLEVAPLLVQGLAASGGASPGEERRWHERAARVLLMLPETTQAAITELPAPLAQSYPMPSEPSRGLRQATLSVSMPGLLGKVWRPQLEARLPHAPAVARERPFPKAEAAPPTFKSLDAEVTHHAHRMRGARQELQGKFEVSRVGGLAWWRARPSQKNGLRPIFSGSQYDVPEPTSRVYNDWYQRVHPSTF